MDHLLSREKDIIEKHQFYLNIIIVLFYLVLRDLVFQLLVIFFQNNKKVFEKWIIL